MFLRFEAALRWSGLIGLACGTSHERGKVIVRESSAGRRNRRSRGMTRAKESALTANSGHSPVRCPAPKRPFAA